MEIAISFSFFSLNFFFFSFFFLLKFGVSLNDTISSLKYFSYLRSKPKIFTLLIINPNMILVIVYY